MSSSFAKYLRLPAEITEFEASYLRRMNRVGVAFFWANLPVFLAVAFFNDTGPLLALVLTVTVLAGPTIALGSLRNPRHVSMVLGFTAMCMGGLLVHFGQGPLQIEMHFYFFSLLAVLAMFANPAVIQVAAVTVTLHHTVIWLLIPASVFNYEASIWVVAVHAAFVVVESVAASFIARSFFDNVIGLDKIVRARTAELDERNDDMRLVLDSVGQGFLTIDMDGQMSAERSAVLAVWFGPAPSDSFQEYLAQVDPAQAEWFELGWMGVADGFLPLEVCLAQLPARFTSDGKHYGMSYRPVESDEGEPTKVLVVISDITAEVARAAAEARQREAMNIFGAFLDDRTGFLEFFDEADVLVKGLVEEEHEGDIVIAKRWLHTLKGNSLVFGLETIAGLSHDLEGAIIEDRRLPTQSERESLATAWSELRDSLDSLLGNRSDEVIELSPADYERLLDALRGGDSVEDTVHFVESWPLEPVGRRLSKIAHQAAGIAERLGKEEVRIHVEHQDVRLSSVRFRSFWSAFVHVIRNALDHGIESPDEREGGSKDAGGLLFIGTRIDDDEFVIEVRDDGRGIDWEAVASKADELGLPSGSQQELIEALFSDGLSTARTVSEVSGRGVGMGATRAAAIELGGRVQVETTPGEGTCVLFTFPIGELEDDLWVAEDLSLSSVEFAANSETILEAG